MPSVPSLDLTADQLRRVVVLAPAVERMTVADAAFFARFPHRRHRLRLMARAEIETVHAAGEAAEILAGERWAVAVKEICPGVRMRRLFTTTDPDRLDQPEHVAAGIYDQIGSDQDREDEANACAIISSCRGGQ